MFDGQILTDFLPLQGQTDCFLPRFLHSVGADTNFGAVAITIHSSTAARLLTYRVDTDGTELREVGFDIAPHGSGAFSFSFR